MLISRAKDAVLNASPREWPDWKTEVGPLVGMLDREITEGLKREVFTEYDGTLAHVIKHCFSKAHSYQDALHKEREEFRKLCHHAHSQARVRHMVETNKPLRN